MGLLLLMTHICEQHQRIGDTQGPDVTNAEWRLGMDGWRLHLQSGHGYRISYPLAGRDADVAFGLRRRSTGGVDGRSVPFQMLTLASMAAIERK